MVAISTDDKKGILNLYRRKGNTLHQIANVYGLPSPAAVYQVLREFGESPSRSPRKPKPPVDPVTLCPQLREVLSEGACLLTDVEFTDAELQQLGVDSVVIGRIRGLVRRLTESGRQVGV